MPARKDQNCGNCRFRVETSYGTAECRRYPPAVVLDGGDKRAFWPAVSGLGWWCGEWSGTIYEGEVRLGPP